MPSYIESNQLPHLDELAQQWETFRREVQFFEDNIREYGAIMGVTLYPNPDSKISGNQGWNQLPFYLQGERATDFVTRHNVTPINANPSPKEMAAFREQYDGFMHTLFAASYRVIDAWFDKHKDYVTNVVLFRLAPGSLIPVHTNFDPHMYRGHLGLIVPEGDVCLRVEGEDRRWREGEFLIFDSMRPHTAWNMTDGARYVLNVDTLRPDVGRSDVLAVHKVLVELRMKEGKLSMGFSGGRSDMLPGLQERYKGPHER